MSMFTKQQKDTTILHEYLQGSAGDHVDACVVVGVHSGSALTQTHNGVQLATHLFVRTKSGEFVKESKPMMNNFYKIISSYFTNTARRTSMTTEPAAAATAPMVRAVNQ